MSTSSPGPGWWLASDGKWYPQRWAYLSFGTAAFDSAHEAMESAANQALPLGLEGWEMVSCSVQPYERKAVSGGDTGGGNIYNLNLRGQFWFASALLKRPIAP